MERRFVLVGSKSSEIRRSPNHGDDLALMATILKARKT
uniref:Uncharacterized protein n=1 Tax=Nelumbo nucifera TaxID=4432 RepID=A0A822YJI6_NELNU|nr:TPA_asm: hypothetical protein HUJ06_004994 [Nelumbo nucifera]